MSELVVTTPVWVGADFSQLSVHDIGAALIIIAWLAAVMVALGGIVVSVKQRITRRRSR